MPTSAFATPGYIQGRSHTFQHEEPLPEQVMNLIQDDLALLSDALVNTTSRMFLPGTFTPDYKLPVVAAPDQVTLEDNVDLVVGGVLFNTHGLASRTFQIPDNSARYLRVGVSPASGLLQAYETRPGVIADPLVRNVTPQFSLVAGDDASDAPGSGGGPTTSASMRLLKAVKAGPGSTPVVTLYANKPGVGITADPPLTQSDLGAPGGVPTLGDDGAVPAAQLMATLRGIYGGIVVEWEASAIPTLSDGLPLGLELDGSVASLAVYPNLMRKWCGADNNHAAGAWYRCDSAGNRTSAGDHIRLQDRRAEFVRGWDHGRGIDAGRALASHQAADNAPHAHQATPPAGATDNQGNHAHGVTGVIVSGSEVILNSGFGGWAAGYAMSDPAGLHSHGVVIPPFTTASQGTEGRPRNVATMFIILV